MFRTRKSDRPTRRTKLRPSLDRLEGRSLMTTTAGALDTTFGSSGTGVVFQPVTPGVGTGLIDLSQVQVESGGSIVAAGPVGYKGNSSYGVVKFNADGTPDTSFGTNGEADAVLPDGLMASAFNAGGLKAQGNPPILLVDPTSGNIFVVGPAGAENNGSSVVTTVVAEFNADGTPDTSFGTDGVVVLDGSNLSIPNGINPVITHAALQGSNLVLAGQSTFGTTIPISQEIIAVQLNADGSFDTTFGTNGVATFSGLPAGDTPATYSDYTEGLVIQPNGQAVILANVAVASVSTPTLIRLNSDGSQDTTLSQAGLQASTIEPAWMIIQPNGDFLLAATGPSLLTPNLVRLNPDGSLGQSLTISNAAARALTGVTLQPNGDIDLFSAPSYLFESTPTVTPSFGVIRVTPSLTLDPSFGKNGVAQITLPNPPTPTGGSTPLPVTADAVAVDADNQIILAGSNYTSIAEGGLVESTPATDLALARLTTTGVAPTPGDFDGDGISDPAIYLTASGSFAIKTSTGGPGETVQFGTAGAGQSIPVLGDFYGTGQDDIAVYLTASGTFAVQDPTGKTSGEMIQFGSPGADQSIPAPGDYYGTGQSDIAVYLPATGTFAIQDPTGATNGKVVQLGIAGTGQSIPVPGDYYGTGQTDLAVYLPASRTWAIQDPTGKTSGLFVPFGMPGLGNSIPVPGDYDGSGKTELAVYIPSLAELIYRPANGGADVTMPFGVEGIGQTLPAPGDYDGLGKTEVAAYIPDQGLFAYRPASGGPDVDDYFGSAGPGQSIPVTSVVLSPFPVPGPTPGGSFEAPGIMGEPDSLDFLPTTAKKAKAGDPSAS